jgi:type IV secretory pathway TrbD component
MSFGLALLLNLMPVIIALVRGKRDLALFCFVLDVVAVILTVTIIFAGMGIIVWLIALFMSGLIGRTKRVEITHKFAKEPHL